MVLKRKARDIMTRTVITAKPDTLVTDVMSLLLRWHISGLPIVDGDGKLLGIVTEADVVNFAISGDTASTTAGEIMTKQVETYTQDTLVVEIVNRFAAKRIRRVPVVEEGKVVGIVSRRDIIRELNRPDIAFDLEGHGHQLYRNEAKKTSSLAAKAVCEYLADEESKHFIRLQNTRNYLASNGAWLWDDMHSPMLAGQ